MVLKSSFPEITTFGSLIRFALELENTAVSLYEGSSKTYPDVAALPLLAGVHRKRFQLLEQTRQQKLNEMILEAIHELNRNDYLVETDEVNGSPLHEVLKRAITLEEQSFKFYGDSARLAKSLLAEASRIFQKLAKVNGENVGTLNAIPV